MKKSTLIFVFAISCFISNAQCVANMNIQQPGIYPEVLPNGTIGLSYQEFTTIALYSDTVYSSFGTVQIDSIEIISVNNLPAGINYSCETSNCKKNAQPPNIYRYCVNFFGTPVTENTNDTVAINMLLYINYFGVNIPLTQTVKVHLKVLDNLGLSSLSNKEDITIVYPNPLNNSFKLNALETEDYKNLTIYSSDGKIISSHSLEHQNKDQPFDFLAPSGIYIFEFQLDNNQTKYARVIKN